MVQSRTHQQQKKDYVYVPERSFSIICAQEIFGNVLRVKADGTYKPYFDNIPSVRDDLEVSRRAAGFIKASDFGTENEFILNKAPESDSITHTEMQAI